MKPSECPHHHICPCQEQTLKSLQLKVDELSPSIRKLREETSLLERANTRLNMEIKILAHANFEMKQKLFKVIAQD